MVEAGGVIEELGDLLTWLGLERTGFSDDLATGRLLAWGVDGIRDAGDVIPGFTCLVRRIFD